jgi:hypothetical protein
MAAPAARRGGRIVLRPRRLPGPSRRSAQRSNALAGRRARRRRAPGRGQRATRPRWGRWGRRARRQPVLPGASFHGSGDAGAGRDGGGLCAPGQPVVCPPAAKLRPSPCAADASAARRGSPGPSSSPAFELARALHYEVHRGAIMFTRASITALIAAAALGWSAPARAGRHVPDHQGAGAPGRGSRSTSRPSRSAPVEWGWASPGGSERERIDRARRADLLARRS